MRSTRVELSGGIGGGAGQEQDDRQHAEPPLGANLAHAGAPRHHKASSADREAGDDDGEQGDTEGHREPGGGRCDAGADDKGDALLSE